MPQKKSPTHVNANGLRELADLQRAAAEMIMAPLSNGDRTARKRPDGTSALAHANTFVKPNDRLNSLERIEIYNRQYWYRLLESIQEDFPGLLALLGEKAFHRLFVAYMAAHPSRSYTLRDLGESLPQFIREHSEFTPDCAALSAELASLEWAQIVAFDNESRPAVTTADLQTDPSQLTLDLQPYITLLSLNYPLDDFLASLHHEQTEHGGASNAVMPSRLSGKKRIHIPAPSPVSLVVHRHRFRVYRKRVHPCAMEVLANLQKGRTLADSLETAFSGPAAPSEGDASTFISEWFSEWSALGWLTLRRG